MHIHPQYTCFKNPDTALNCDHSPEEAETKLSLQLASQLVWRNWRTPGSMKDVVSKNKTVVKEEVQTECAFWPPVYTHEPYTFALSMTSHVLTCPHESSPPHHQCTSIDSHTVGKAPPGMSYVFWRSSLKWKKAPWVSRLPEVSSAMLPNHFVCDHCSWPSRAEEFSSFSSYYPLQVQSFSLPRVRMSYHSVVIFLKGHTGHLRGLLLFCLLASSW